jgi:glycosyltransferase involved in cell wall biosynthesis
MLVTPARNEAAFIEDTIRAVAAQTVRPRHWVIVSDGSTDGTDDIVRRQMAAHGWIELLRMPERGERHFAAKALCFNAGFDRLRNEDYDIVGNLDADITFQPDYFEFLLGRFAADPGLGVAGTPFVEDAEHRDRHSYGHGFADLRHVSGACQLFSRECFQAVGGYVPVKMGAIDWIAVTTARMRGWRTRTFTERVCFHHRRLGTGTHSPLWVRYQYGMKAYCVGGHPFWELARGLFQMRESPVVFGGLFFIAGYLGAFIRRKPRTVTPELMAFHRGEQWLRIKRAFAGSPASTSGAGSC